MSNESLDERKTFELLAHGDITGIFPPEELGIQHYVAGLQTASIADLALVIALYRPGVLVHLGNLVKARNRSENVYSHHPLLELILEETYGLIVYQDQVVRIAQDVAGYNVADANRFRKTLAKRHRPETQRQRVRFVTGAADRGVSPQVAAELFDLVEPYAGYAYERGHAVRSAIVAFHKASLRANGPVEQQEAG